MGKSAGALLDARILLSILCAVLLFGASYPLLVPAEGRRSRAPTLAEAQYKTRAAKANLRAARARKAKAESDLYSIQMSLASAEAELERATVAWHEAREQLVETTVELRRAEERLHNHQEAVGDRLAEIHQDGEISYLDVLLGAESFADFANQLYIAQLIVQDDIDLLRALEEDQKRVARMHRQLEIDAQRAADYRDLVAARQALVARREALKQAQLAALTKDLPRYEQEYAKWLSLARSLAPEIQRRSKVYRVAPWTGRLKPPVAGPITSGFGMRMHPILHKWKMHTGVDIAARYGTPIRASGDGVVIYTGWRGGYGRTIIVSHGNGLSTLYAHCSGIDVYEGRKVKQGDVIGRVGATGLATGPHVHFEVRVNGRCVDPMTY